MIWSESTIGAAIANQTFQRRFLIVPNCNWTGHECDLLAVANSMHVIDVEIKISRSDLKADAKKAKWRGYQPRGMSSDMFLDRPANPWPRGVWKHYYAMPKAIWAPELIECLPSPNSGILLLDGDGYPRPVIDYMRVDCIRRAKPNPEAKPITSAQAIDIARLASLRMWDAYRQVESLRREAAIAKAEGAS